MAKWCWLHDIKQNCELHCDAVGCNARRIASIFHLTGDSSRREKQKEKKRERNNNKTSDVYDHFNVKGCAALISIQLRTDSCDYNRKKVPPTVVAADQISACVPLKMY